MANYRPDIDGLRAVAIISVVAFHVGLPLFSGGFVGVDVFFVISGYLITRLLYDELESTGRIKFLDFYARRARRLFPALALVCLTTLVLGFWLLLPFGEQQDLAKSAIATALFSSNTFFWMQSGYFDGPADLKPLLNMWSLAVEEQFYWVWPLLILAVWRGFVQRSGGRQAMVIALMLIATISFGGSLWVTEQSQSIAFYMMPIRAWEFALGGILALSPSPVSMYQPWLRHVLSVIGVTGLGLIAWSVCSFSRATTFPGAAALIPVVGTAMVILGGQTGHGPVFRLLTLPVVVTIGLLSYWWYLWHWPLLALARSYEFGKHELLRDFALALAALSLAALTYRFLENPARYARTGPFATTRGTLVAGSGLLVLVLISAAALGGWAKYQAHSTERGRALLTAMRDRVVVNPECDIVVQSDTFKGILPPVEKCRFGGENQRILLWGDSFAEHYVPLLDSLGRKYGLGLIIRSLGACPPILGVVPIRAGLQNRDCAVFNNLVAEELEEYHAIGFDSAILSADWLMQDPDPNETTEQVSRDEVLKVFAEGLVAILSELELRGFRVLLVAPSVKFPVAVPLCLGRRPAEMCGISRADFEARRGRILAVMQAAVQGRQNVKIYDPVTSLCNATYCPPILNDVIAYRDKGHVAASALQALESDFQPLVQWLAKRHSAETNNPAIHF